MRAQHIWQDCCSDGDKQGHETCTMRWVRASTRDCNDFANELQGEMLRPYLGESAVGRRKVRLQRGRIAQSQHRLVDLHLRHPQRLRSDDR